MAAEVPARAQSAQTLDAHERARAYEIAAYLSAASFPFDIADGPPANPIPSTDITLNALVQHGAQKMGCDRAFLSFIDNRSQFICAEMTSHQSVVDANPTQPLLLGTTRIALEWGVCPYTMSIFHGRKVALPASPYIVANESYFYIKDFRQVPSFAARPFVVGYPHMVSYIEIPLRSLSGHILGSYCVVDNKQRDFLHPDALRTIREVNLAISQYLDLKRAEGGRMRSERMIHGLRQFIGLHHHMSAGSTETRHPFSLDIFEKASRIGPESQSDENMESNQVSNCQVDSNVVSEVLPIAKPDSTPDVFETTTMSPSKDNISKGITSSLFGRISDLFPKAANIIGHAMNLDGLMFFDAVDTGARDRGSRSSYSFTYGKSAPHVNEKVQSLAQPLSEYQGDVTAESQMVDRPSQSLIQRLTAAYPHGYVFTVDEYGVFEPSFQGMEVGQGLSDTSAIHGEWKELFDCIPKARYAIFLPLWHYQRESCFATCLAWVSDPGKTLETNDINSLTAFGNSLMAKIYRLEAATSTQQKSDFVSSVSHELRSPLHGILATVELMQENMDDPRLLSMTQMIESCSYTLLDTFDHLLEFSKINSLKGGRESAARDEGNADTPHTQKLAIDLGSLVEDVLQTVSLGHNSASQIELRLKNEHQNSPASGVEVPPLPVLITTYIDHNLEWTSHMDRGAWKRILLNILSNALRFTESGHIDVTLKMLEGADAGTRCISLSVTDTGVGMSPEFLKYHLFTPFMQENSLVSGTGLGLSIVKSIVESLEGKIFVESHQHEGTCVTVNIPLDKELGTPSQSDAVGSLGLGDRMPNLTVSVISIASQRAPNNKSALNVVALPELLQRCLRNICEKHFGMTVVVDIPWNALLKQDIVLLDAHGISSNEIFDFQWQFPEVVSAMASRPVVVLGPTTKGMEQFFTREGATFISSAITRKNLWDGIITALNKMVPTAAIPCCMSSVNSRQPSHQAEAPIQGGLLKEDEPIVTQSKPVNLPMRSASPQAGVGAKGVATSPPRPRQQSPLYPLHTIMADSPDSHLIYRYRRLLLVDDNPINLKLLVAFAKRIGLPFATAFDGAEAVRLYKKAIEEEADPFDCVFMDISMPVMDGFQATVAIRQFEEQQRKEHQDRDANTYKKKSQDEGDNEQQKETPLRAVRSNIMAFTGLGSEEARSMARNSGFDLFLVKPVKFKDVEPLLRHLPVNSEGSLLLNLE